MLTHRRTGTVLVGSLLLLALSACGSSSNPGTGGGGASATSTSSTSGSTDTNTTGTGGTGTGSTTTTSGSTTTTVTSTVDCSQTTTKLEEAVCAAKGLLDGLPANQLSQVNLAYGDSASRTKWSNLPVGMVPRAGVKMSALDAASQAAALNLMNVVLSAAGQDDLEGIRAADDYLGTKQGGYGSGLYSIAVFGTPSTTADWAIMFGGHHMAFNISFVGGVGYPTPNHVAVEPKAPFTVNGKTYAPLSDEADALVAVYDSLSTTELASAYLAGKTFMDVIVGPVEYGTGSTASSKAKFPTGANRTGVLVSSLSTAQQSLVKAAIEGWVRNFVPEIADTIVADYTSAAAFADTYVAFGGGSSSGVNVDVQGTYMRLDGPRLWIEVSCQGGIVIQGQTHYHTIYRDKQLDYGGSI